MPGPCDARKFTMFRVCLNEGDRPHHRQGSPIGSPRLALWYSVSALCPENWHDQSAVDRCFGLAATHDSDSFIALLKFGRIIVVVPCASHL